MLSTNKYSVATSRGINQLIYLDTQKQQQLNKVPVIPPLSPHPSSQYTNTSVHESDISTMDPSLTYPIKEIQVHKPTLQPKKPTLIYDLLHHQQGVYTRDRIQQYYPLYPGLDNDIQSPSSSFSNSSSDTSTPFPPLTSNSPYQDVVNWIQQLTHSYNNSSYFIQKPTSTSNRNTFLHDSTSSLSNSNTSTAPLAIIPLPSYHDYTFNSKTSSQHTIVSKVNNL